MAPITIKVTGSSTIHQPPEQAVLTFYAQSEGTSADTVSREVTTTSNQIQQTLHDLKADTTSTGPSPITTFKTSALHSWSERPQDHDGNYGARVYNAQLRFEATFLDFKKLASIAGRLAAYPTVSISNLDWQLTTETQRRLSVQTRKSAMQDAIEKAADLAGVVGRRVEPVEISDSGFGPGVGGRSVMCMKASANPMDDEREELDLTPEDVELSSSVNVVFQGE